MSIKKDFTQVAHAVFEQAIGAVLPTPQPVKKDSAVTAGRKGGLARKAKLSAEDRSRIASDAAKTRWKK
jgi:hypothetical protein